MACGSETGQGGEAGGPVNLMRLWGTCVCPCPWRGATSGLWLGKQMAALWTLTVPPARDLHRTGGGERVPWALFSPEAQCGWDPDLVFSSLALDELTLGQSQHISLSLFAESWRWDFRISTAV